MLNLNGNHPRNWSVQWQHTASYVRVTVHGAPSMDEFCSILREIERDTDSWERPALLLDLRPMRKVFGMAEQILIGTEMGCRLSGLFMIAAVEAPGQGISNGVQRHADRMGVTVTCFATDVEAMDWLLEMDAVR